MAIKDKLLEYGKIKNMNASKFCQYLGLSNGFFTRKSGITTDILEGILDKCADLNPDWLLTGKGEMLRKDPSAPRLQKSPDGSGIPLVEIKAVAGFGNADFTITEADVKDYYIVPKFRFCRIDFMIEISGSSMYPKYNSGDVVACTILRERSFIQWNKCHIIASASQGIMCKRLLPSDKQGYIKAVSDNTNYPPFEVPESDILGIALVVGVIHLE